MQDLSLTELNYYMRNASLAPLANLIRRPKFGNINGLVYNVTIVRQNTASRWTFLRSFAESGSMPRQTCV